MKKFDFIMFAIALVSTVVCAGLHYFSGEHIQACFWLLWAILLTKLETSSEIESR